MELVPNVLLFVLNAKDQQKMIALTVILDTIFHEQAEDASNAMKLAQFVMDLMITTVQNVPLDTLWMKIVPFYLMELKGKNAQSANLVALNAQA